MIINGETAEATVNFCTDGKLRLEARRSDLTQEDWVVPVREAEDLLGMLDTEYLGAVLVFSAARGGRKTSVCLENETQSEMDDLAKDIAHALEAAEESKVEVE